MGCLGIFLGVLLGQKGSPPNDIYCTYFYGKTPFVNYRVSFLECVLHKIRYGDTTRQSIVI